MYDENLANDILLALEKAFPKTLGIPELRGALGQCDFSGSDKQDWLTAIDALNRSGCIDDRGLHRHGVHQPIDAVAKLLITDLGRVRAAEIRKKIESVEKLEKICDLTFENATAALYEDVERQVKGLARQYAAKGIVSSGSFARAVVDLVLDRFKGLRTAFIGSYVATLQKAPAGIDTQREQWLKAKLEEVWEREILRAKAEASRLAQSNGLSAAEVHPLISELEIKAREWKQKIAKEIEIAILSDEVLAAPNEAKVQALTSGSKAPARVKQEELADPERSRRVFVIHGRDLRLRQGMFDFLRSIGLEPMEWTSAIGYTQKGSPYIGEILDAAFRQAQAVVALLSPDDLAKLRDDLLKENDPTYERHLTGQARPNVLFEAGMAFASHPEQTVLVQIGNIRPFSDVAGRHVVQMDNTSARRQELAVKLRNAGCAIKLDGTDWHTTGDLVPLTTHETNSGINSLKHTPLPTGQLNGDRLLTQSAKDDFAKLEHAEEEALKLLLLRGPMTERNAISKLHEQGSLQRNVVHIFERIEAVSGYVERVGPFYESDHQLGYRGEWQIRPDKKALLRTLIFG